MFESVRSIKIVNRHRHLAASRTGATRIIREIQRPELNLKTYLMSLVVSQTSLRVSLQCISELKKQKMFRDTGQLRESCSVKVSDLGD